MSALIHAWPTTLAAFLASAVEFVEALTVVLAVGVVRGWRGAIAGAAAALACLVLVAVILGPVLMRLPLGPLQLAIGTLLVLFGMRWLRKAVLRSAGVIPLHDEAAAYAKTSAALRGTAPGGAAWVAVGTAFEITMLEGLEVVFIVVAMGAGGPQLLLPAAAGALAALVLVVAVGIAVHGPLSTVPENALKFGVGVLLSGFGTFWIGEGIGLDWPGADLSIVWLCLGFLAVALALVPLCRPAARAADAA
ncbi:MAG: hypothetical protein INR64_09110 [Caulobacteraceae bacterium]|nr:hypothetical protein [Caulobacter sp.]